MRSRLSNLAALDALPARQREALRLKHLEGRTLAETAGLLNCSVAAAAGLLARGMRTLRGRGASNS
jgi:RNA polymerase sigma factor (sigma-70 family)